jgi:protoporphyrinogen/coproporphyrinogen III oxidase
MRDVVVIGGGVSGLASACELADRGHDVTLLERQATPGGNAISDRFGGWLMEHGPSTLNAAFLPPESQVSRLGLDETAEPLGPRVRKRYLRDGDRLTGISTHPAGFLLSRYLSLPGKLSLAAEILRPRRRGGGDESLHGFATRRFGREFADKVIAPMAAGIFMADARDLSASGAFPRLVGFETSHGSVLRAILSAQRGAEPGRRMQSWADGIATLPRAMAVRLGDAVRVGVAVTGLRRYRNGFTIETARDGSLRARAVVLAVQPHVAAGLVAGLDGSAGAALGAIPAPPVAVVFMGFRRAQLAHPLDGLGFLSTLTPGRIVSGVQFPSTMFAGRAPDGHVALSAYVGGTRAAEAARWPADALLGAVLDELRPVLDLSGAPLVHRVRHWPRGLPQYTIGHGQRRDTIETVPDRMPGLVLTGNYLSGVAVTGCLAAAGRAAARVHLHLAGGSASLGDESCTSVGGAV